MEDEVFVEVCLGLRGVRGVVEVIECHTGVALDGPHGRFIGEIFGGMVGDVGFAFETEHPGELGGIMPVQYLPVCIHQLLSQGRKGIKEERFELKGSIPTGVFGLTWSKEYLHLGYFFGKDYNKIARKNLFSLRIS